VPPDRPNGASRLCLSCHDGALALGALLNLDATRPAAVAMQGGVTTMPPGPRNLGTDLRNDHPISLPIPSTDPEVVAPPGGDPVKLHPGPTATKDRVQCTSCHDPHLTTPRFLVKSNLRGALCITCHPKQGWLGSRHEASLAPYPATGAQTVGDLGCLACHKPHNGEGPTKLLTTQNLSGAPLAWSEENVCYSCHRAGGTGIDPARGRAAPDIQTEALKASRHPFNLKLDEHQPIFTAKTPEPEAVLNVQRHVECADCHNPHQVQALPGNVHEGSKGISISGAVVVDNAGTNLAQYEVCLRCHGDTFSTMIPAAATRPPSGSNKRTEFQTSNDAFHPVAGPGRNPSTYLNNVLDSPQGQMLGLDWQGNRLNRFSTVLCTDCHNNQATANTTGSARQSSASPKGPHGSTNPRLLRANYSTAVGTNDAPFGGYNANNFALCFLCHDEGRLRGNYSNFFQAGGVGAGRGNLHQVHLVDRTNSSCHECHYNVHSNVAATNTDYRNVPAGTPTHLVNFAPPVSRGSGNDPWYGDSPTRPRWGRTPSGDYYCFAGCHGKADAMDGDKSRYRPPNP
jgi:predicted CXXCH cytochrome family protein